MESSSVAVIAEVPTIIYSSLKMLVHVFLVSLVKGVNAEPNCSKSSTNGISHELIPPLMLFTMTFTAKLS